ncbi:12867_t:CDS:2, partial [Acaulospora colombiana]
NIVVVKKVDTPNRFGDVDYLGFEHVTMSPMHRKLIDKSLLTPEELKWVNSYHAEDGHHSFGKEFFEMSAAPYFFPIYGQ